MSTSYAAGVWDMFICDVYILKVDIDGVRSKNTIQQKILKISDFPKKWDSNPLPHEDNAADIAKMFAKFFSQKSAFG
jgi:hypothetical protein